jgi:hypothetical protein
MMTEMLSENWSKILLFNLFISKPFIKINEFNLLHIFQLYLHLYLLKYTFFSSYI